MHRFLGFILTIKDSLVIIIIITTPHAELQPLIAGQDSQQLGCVLCSMADGLYPQRVNNTLPAIDRGAQGTLASWHRCRMCQTSDCW
ncbi:hypothetical protein GDO81_003041 [Engystomops pustulosus]|uniref:Secreted protein n=1 Tax=Engystomops pustulosus TaxID=76066 RepID=A0AAV6ZW83_ENGPU|nr:hypothetical protein GDO81_003041 [Engystomops pustulosus]